MIRTLLRTILLFSLAPVLLSCGEDEYDQKAFDVKVLATDVYISVAQHTLVLPVIALETVAYQEYWFALYPRRRNEQARYSLEEFLRETTRPAKPLVLDGISVWLDTYGWDDGDSGRIRVCPLLTRNWARSMCDNPWAAIRQALPHGRFKLVDLTRLRIGNPQDPTNCRDGKPRQPLPQAQQEAIIVCEAMVYGARDGTSFTAVVRIDGDLGALWGVGESTEYDGETAREATEREGKAIVAFVQSALRSKEDFPTLLDIMCLLRRPGSSDSPNGAECESTDPP